MAGLERYSTKTLRTFAIGDIGPGGGFIFATPSTSGNATGKYFEAAPYQWNGSGADPTRTWAETTYQTVNVSGATGTAYGTGYANTLAIIAQGNTDPATSAAALARTCTSGGKNDWFLPSSFELGQMVSALFYDNGDIGGLNNPSNPGSANYWSSTQGTSTAYGPAASRAEMWLWLGDAGPLKSELYSVRPVRMFSVTPSTSVQRIGNDSVYGTGSDGTVVIASNTSLTRDMYYSSLTINSGSHLNTNGFKVFVKNTLTVNGSIGINAGVAVSNATLVGTSNIAANTTNSIGGSAAGVTYTASQVSSDVRSYIENILMGASVSVSGTVAAFTGGAGGGNGAAGTVTPATAGSGATNGAAGSAGSGATAGGAGGAGDLGPHRNVLAPGGNGTAGTPGTNGAAGSAGSAGTNGAAGTTPPAASGGTGARGGGVVLVCAKSITGSGSIVSLGSHGGLGGNSATGTGATNGANGTGATAGGAGSAGSAGTAAPGASIAHHVNSHAHIISGDGTHGAHVQVPSPALPRGHIAAAHGQHAHGSYTNTHHGATPVHPENHHGGSSPTYGSASTGYAHVAPSGYYHQNGINHTVGGHLGHDGAVAHGHSGDVEFGVNSYHETDHHHVGGYKTPHHTASQARPRTDRVGHHFNGDHRNAGDQRHVGHTHKAGGAAGSAGSAGTSGTSGSNGAAGTNGTNGSTTAGAHGQSGGGGGIFIITDSTPTGVTTSVAGGTIGGVSASSGNIITVLNA